MGPVGPVGPVAPLGLVGLVGPVGPVGPLSRRRTLSSLSVAASAKASGSTSATFSNLATRSWSSVLWAREVAVIACGCWDFGTLCSLRVCPRPEGRRRDGIRAGVQCESCDRRYADHRRRVLLHATPPGALALLPGVPWGVAVPNLRLPMTAVRCQVERDGRPSGAHERTRNRTPGIVSQANSRMGSPAGPRTSTRTPGDRAVRRPASADGSGLDAVG